VITSLRSTHLRWSSYFVKRVDDYRAFWTSYFLSSTKNVLVVLGMGFDPRTCHGLASLTQLGGIGKRDCLAIEYNEGSDSPSREYSKLVNDNRESLKQLLPEGSSKTFRTVSFWSDDRRRRSSRNAADIFTRLSDLSSYSDVIVDVSAMPRGIYFPLIGKILYLLDTAVSVDTNLHVIVSENARLDARIREQGIDEDASYMHGFTGTLDTEGAAETPKIWIPILGERKLEQLERIYTLVAPDEVCPILPMPSDNPRRADDLLLEYRDFLFDRLRVEPKNFIYVSEQNPFETYREIHRTVRHYNAALSTLGGCQVVVSALSSKLLSIGALLAAYELKNEGLGVGLAHVETQGYVIEGALDAKRELDSSKLTTMWLAGDCYAK
jgi:hypothetical protein